MSNNKPVKDPRDLTIDLLVDDILKHGKSMDDERIKPELRDIKRLLRWNRPRTTVGIELAEKAGY